jgi:2-isopropylmalate synthase
MTEKLIIFDTTLRDGEQSPGAAMTREKKLRIARQLEKLGVDVIEAGFAAASVGDFESVQAVAQAVKESTICSLARAGENDVRRAGEAIRSAKSGRIHIFIATSPIHMQHKLRMNEDQVVARAVEAVKHALEYTDDVEFSAEDAVRSEMNFLVRIYDEMIKAGVKTLNVPDTVGYSIPLAWGERIKQLITQVPGADKVIWSTHCHNDLGLAVANSLSAVMNGARQVECTINGLGERAGNAALEEIVMAVKTRRDIFNLDTRIDTTQIVATSKLVSSITGYPVQPNKAIVGANAFAHESGIHQDGVLKHRETYEIMRAEDVGWNANKLTLGKLSGRNALRSRFTALNIEFATEDLFNAVFMRFKDLADRKNEIFDEDLQALASDDALTRIDEHYHLIFLKVHSETGIPPVAVIVISIGGVSHEAQMQGGGPIDATFKAIEKIVQSCAQLQLYSVNNITSGTDAQGEVTVRLFEGGHIVNGQGADTDIVVASAKAYLNALNKLHSHAERAHPQL